MNDVTRKVMTTGQLLRTTFRRKIGLCWGGFDFLHAGHILHFDFAKSRVSTLIVAINADEAFPDKGPNRPFFSEQRRAHLIASIAFVDAVTIYHGSYLDPAEAQGTLHGRAESTPFVPMDIITRIRPDYYFKGIEYVGQVIPESRLVERCGGRVVFGPREPVFSSSRLIRDLGTA